MIRKLRNGLLILALVGGVCSAQPFDRGGRTEVLGEPERDWVFIGSSLVDVNDNRFLGVVGTAGAFAGPAFTFSPDGRFMYAAESFYARATRGERTDTITIFDTQSLAAVGEVVIPPKRALMIVVDGSTALSDNERFLAVFNLTPATSISIVDIENQAFVGEISAPGCSLVFAAGELRYVMLCANGGLLTVTLNADGSERSKVRTEGFFDPSVDPIRESGVRYQDEWLFVSFDGTVHPLNIAGTEPQFGETWSLLTAEDRADNWRVAGRQHLTVHQQTGRFYSLMRQSDVPLDDPNDFDGGEIWVYDLATRERVQRFEALPEREAGSSGGGGIGATSGDGASGIIVTQGDAPRLVTMGGGISVRDALTGEYVHETMQNVPGSGHLNLRLQ